MSANVDEWLREIDETAVSVFDLAAREKVREKAGSQRKAYEKGLREVRQRAGDDAARELADWIQSEMREKERYPSARNVRQRGAKICRDRGHEISTNDWLGA